VVKGARDAGREAKVVAMALPAVVVSEESDSRQDKALNKNQNVVYVKICEL
jgi:hypothetical protein